MFTHRAFESSRAFRALIAVLGSMAMQGSVITWVADHRKRHAVTDQDGDPHSPHLSGPGVWGATSSVAGAWRAPRLASPRGRAQPDSSGAIVNPAPSSCSQ